MALTFQAGKRYVTRDGRTAAIDHIAPDGNWCLMGRCKGKSGWCYWNKIGRYDKDGYDHAMDLVSEFDEGVKGSEK